MLFDLGIPGLSTFSPRAQTWIVRASSSDVRGDRRGHFELTGDDRLMALAVEHAALKRIDYTVAQARESIQFAQAQRESASRPES